MQDGEFKASLGYIEGLCLNKSLAKHGDLTPVILP
jgi:hypothetical protein